MNEIKQTPVIFLLDNEKKRLLKIKAIKQNKTLKEYITDLINKDLEEI